MAHEVTAKDLDITLAKGDEAALFKWFLASFLFGKRIQQDIAVDAYHVIVDKYKRDSPRKLCNCSWQTLVDMLGEGRYVRYDESTAERLLKLCDRLNKEYKGRVGTIFEVSDSRKELDRRLGEFEGVGPKTIEIFMREAGPVWRGSDSI